MRVGGGNLEAVIKNISHSKNLLHAFNNGWRKQDEVNRTKVCGINGTDCIYVNCVYNLEYKKI
jgi:hypothetical protein